MKDLGTESHPARERVKRLTAQQQSNSHEALGSQRQRNLAKRYLIRRMIVVAFSVLMLGAGVFLIVGNSGLATLLALLGLLSLILLLLFSLLSGSQSIEKTASITVASPTLKIAPNYYPLLRSMREKLGWSQMELANRVGTTAVNVSRWERGVTSPNSYFRAQLNKLFEEYGEEEYKEAYTDMSPLPIGQISSARLTRDLHSPLFFADVPLPTPSAFFGRERERMQLLTCVVKETAVSIVGARKMGKTWLLEYLLQVAPTELGERTTMGYVNAAFSTCDTLTGFIGETLKALGYYDRVSAPKHSSRPDLALLEKYIHSLQEEWLVILCIDNFEALTHYPEEFDRSFFEAMRAMAQRDLCLVITSKKPLFELLKESIHSSPFFNIFSQIKLHPFNEAEASEFVYGKGLQAGFTAEEQENLLKSSQDRTRQWPPLRLQLACKLFLEQKKEQETTPSLYWQKFNKQLDEQYKQIIQ